MTDEKSDEPNELLKFFRHNPAYFDGNYEVFRNPNATSEIMIHALKTMKEHEFIQTFMNNPLPVEVLIEFPEDIPFYDFNAVKGMTDYPDMNWDMSHLSDNIYLPIQYVIDNINKTVDGEGWDWYSLTCNPAMTTDIIDAHPELPWDMGAISRNKTVTVEYIKAHPEIEWDYYWLSYNSNITADFIRKNRDEDWCRYGLGDKCHIETISLDEYISMIDDGILLFYSHILVNTPDVDHVLERFDDINYDMKVFCLVRNENFETRHLIKLIEAGTPISTIFHGESFGDKVDVPEFMYHEHGVLTSKIDIEFILSHPEYPWAWDYLHSNESITIDHLREIHSRGLDKHYDHFWHFMITRPRITMEDIMSTKDELPWNYSWILKNPNMTLEFYLAHPEIDFVGHQNLGGNPFNRNPIVRERIVRERQEKNEIFENTVRPFLEGYCVKGDPTSHIPFGIQNIIKRFHVDRDV